MSFLVERSLLSLSVLLSVAFYTVNDYFTDFFLSVKVFKDSVNVYFEVPHM